MRRCNRVYATLVVPATGIDGLHVKAVDEYLAGDVGVPENRT